MTSPQAPAVAASPAWVVWLRDLARLGKLRLSLTVVLSAGLGYAIGERLGFRWGGLAWLLLGGLLVTVSANALNEVLERHRDALMRRTANRPLPAGRWQPWQAVLFALLTGFGGLGVLTGHFGLLTGGLALVSILSYAFVYTPLKAVSVVAVLVGAVPGALPPVIGFAASTGGVGVEGWALFALQFAWQLPHFWAIAWLANDDYARAGYQLLPFPEGGTRRNAGAILLLTLPVLFAGALPWFVGLISDLGLILGLFLGIIYCVPAFNLYRSLSRKAALALMGVSFLYLPLMLLLVLLTRL